MRSEVWEQHSSDIVETLRRAMMDANMSIDELSALSGIDRGEIVAAIVEGPRIDPRTSAILAATLSGRIAEFARQKAEREAANHDAAVRRRSGER